MTRHARKDEQTQGNQPEDKTQDQQKEIPGDGAEPQECCISLSRSKRTVNHCYLGSIVCKEGGADIDIKNHMNNT